MYVIIVQCHFCRASRIYNLKECSTVYNQLHNHLLLNKLLYESHYGFRKSHSTELAALELIDPIYKHLDQGKTQIAVFSRFI